MSERKFDEIVQETFGPSAGAMSRRFLKQNSEVAESEQLQHKILEKIGEFKSREEVLNFLFEPFNKESFLEKDGLNNNLNHPNNDNLTQIMNNVLGKALASASLDFLQEQYPELKNSETRDKYAEIIKSPPEFSQFPTDDSLEDRQFYMIASSLKIAMIKGSIDPQKDEFEHKDLYRDFNQLMERTLPSVKYYADRGVYWLHHDEDIDFEHIDAFQSSTEGYCHMLMHNEFHQKEDTSPENAQRLLWGIKTSVGGDIQSNNGKRALEQFRNCLTEIVEDSQKHGTQMFEYGIDSMTQKMRQSVEKRKKITDKIKIGELIDENKDMSSFVYERS